MLLINDVCACIAFKTLIWLELLHSSLRIDNNILAVVDSAVNCNLDSSTSSADNMSWESADAQLLKIDTEKSILSSKKDKFERKEPVSSRR